AINDYGESDWSERWSFKTEEEPGIPVLKPSSAKNSYALGQPYWVDIVIDDSVEVSNLFGLSAKFHTSSSFTKYVDKSAQIGDFFSGEVLEFYSVIDSQTVDLAISLTDGEGISGTGKIARAQFISDKTGQVNFSLFDITANDAEGNSIKLHTDSLQINIVKLPDPVNLISPKPDSSLITTSAKLRWSDTNLATSYNVQLSNSDNFESTIIDTTLADTSLTLNALSYDSTYYWKVKAINDGGGSDWSEVWNFKTIQQSPEAVVLLEPT
ncbi:MAG TPA: hypothetical protein DEG32_06335, partial [Balneolaceae bacterium]|nr:hypothetical protein [Balneolaceae bacterium]